MNQKLVFWDIDGTLMSCHNDGTIAMNETFRRRTGHENALSEVMVGTAMDSQLVDRVMDRLGMSQEEKPQIVREFAAILQETVERNANKRVMPGVQEILHALQKREDVHMALLTSNFRVGAEIKLKSVGLWHYFSYGGFGDFPGEKWDAARSVIQEMERATGAVFRPSDVFVIGDGSYDIQCAKHIGAVSVAVATGWMSQEELREEHPDYLFESLEDPVPLLALFLSEEDRNR